METILQRKKNLRHYSKLPGKKRFKKTSALFQIFFCCFGMLSGGVRILDLRILYTMFRNLLCNENTEKRNIFKLKSIFYVDFLLFSTNVESV